MDILDTLEKEVKFDDFGLEIDNSALPKLKNQTEEFGRRWDEQEEFEIKRTEQLGQDIVKDKRVKRTLKRLEKIAQSPQGQELKGDIEELEHLLENVEWVSDLPGQEPHPPVDQFMN